MLGVNNVRYSTSWLEGLTGHWRKSTVMPRHYGCTATEYKERLVSSIRSATLYEVVKSNLGGIKC